MAGTGLGLVPEPSLWKCEGVAMNNNNFSNYHEMYKIARNSVEHFDKILGGFRQIIFTLNGIFIGAGVTYYVHCIQTGKTINYTLIFFANFTFAIANFLVWQLEKHYHRYLTMSAKVAEHIERLIYNLASELNIALTYQLREARNTIFNDVGDLQIPRFIRRILRHISRYIRTYDLLYVIPIFGSGIISFGISMCIDSKGKNWYVYLSSFLFVIYLYCAYIIIHSSYWFSKYYQGTEFFDAEIKKIECSHNAHHDDIRRIARSIYEKRLKDAQTGSDLSDWDAAEDIYNNKICYYWWCFKHLLDGRYSPNLKYRIKK